VHKTQNTNLPKTQSTNKYRELEERTKLFAKKCRDYVQKLPKTISNIEYGKQLIRSSGSQAANYLEANEALSKKDFIHKIRICRKELKESGLWIELTQPTDTQREEQKTLLNEGEELRKIFSAILDKSS
jgi:four helix bundle protein